MRFAIIAAAAAVLLPTLSMAQIPPAVAPSVQVAVSVSIPTPAGVPRATVEVGMARSVPTYAAVPGLIRKYFTIGQADFGGLYLFRDRASAQAWFTDAWRARVVATYGAQPTVTYFDVPLVVDNSVAK
ncbi:YdhR family protein [Sphingomonas sp.]|uniref:YdhR family protein n=1 Tax=Sphingomonas sp. TaxID=28214 RepID=UPI003CC59115